MLKDALAEAPDDSLRWKPSESQCSVHEIIVLCADVEMQGVVRPRMRAGEANPVIAGWNQEAWPQALNDHDQPLEPALALVGAIRTSTSALMSILDDGVWEIDGKRTEGGTYTADDMLEIYHDHLHAHAFQIRDNIEAWRAATGGDRTG